MGGIGFKGFRVSTPPGRANLRLSSSARLRVVCEPCCRGMADKGMSIVVATKASYTKP